jgi:SET domain-containing protein
MYSMDKKEIINDLENHIFCRIQRSAIHGVGVFAVKEIPKGTEPLITFNEVDAIPVPESEIMDNPKISDAVKEMVRAFYVIRDGNIYCDDRSFNEINISYFLNHAASPNLDTIERNEETHFIANRDIHVGEELTSDQSTYSDTL